MQELLNSDVTVILFSAPPDLLSRHGNPVFRAKPDLPNPELRNPPSDLTLVRSSDSIARSGFDKFHLAVNIDLWEMPFFYAADPMKMWYYNEGGTKNRYREKKTKNSSIIQWGWDSDTLGTVRNRRFIIVCWRKWLFRILSFSLLFLSAPFNWTSIIWVQITLLRFTIQKLWSCMDA